MKKILVNASAILAGTLAALPLPAFAIPNPNLDVDTTNVGDPGAYVESILQTVADWFLLVAGSLAVIYLIWAGIQYITGAAENAKKQIINAVIGVLVIVLAYAIVTAAIALVG